MSTIALSGSMTRIPRVCMSMVASAFQYGWRPTLMPVTTTLISPPAWVNSMIRRSTAPIQSMFSVPLRHRDPCAGGHANHSTGKLQLLRQVQGGDDPAALGLGQRAQAAAGVAER